MLGDTIAQIAREKAGIIKPGVVVVSSPQPPEAELVIRDAARSQAAALVEVGRAVRWKGGLPGPAGQTLRITGRCGVYDTALPLWGAFQQENAATAVAALEVLREGGFRLPAESFCQGLDQVSWPGRFQLVSRSPRVILDGAHNQDSARRLREALESYCGARPDPAAALPVERRTLVLGTSLDKDIEGIAAELVPWFDAVVVTETRHARAMPREKVAAAVSRLGIAPQVSADLPAALSAALGGAGRRDLICVTGSLFLVAEAMAALKHLPLSGG